MSIATIDNIGNRSDSSKPELLWTNPDDTVAFAPQTVSLDLSHYKTICIYYKTNGISGKYAFAFYPMGANITIPATTDGYPNVISAGYGQTASMKSTGRNITISSTSIVFGSGYTSDAGANNIYAIPVKIYGIKAQIYPDNV